MASILNVWDIITSLLNMLGQHGQYSECLGHHHQFIEHVGTFWDIMPNLLNVLGKHAKSTEHFGTARPIY